MPECTKVGEQVDDGTDAVKYANADQLRILFLLLGESHGLRNELLTRSEQE